MNAKTSGWLSLCCCLIFNLLFFLVDQTLAEKKLKFVTVIFRHGDRSPTRTYPKDIYQESSWPDGFGQLSKIGKQQQYELGQYLKKRYNGFLSPSYNRHEVHVLSTDMDRTLMSAQANLAGLFPPTGDQIWNPNITWQPIPVHTVPQLQDKLLLMPFRGCRYYDDLLKETYTSEHYHRLVDPYSEFLQMIAEKTGLPSTHHVAWRTYDTLFCERIHNFTLPDWADEKTMAKLSDLSDISLSVLYGVYKHHEKSRLQGGVLLNGILKNITNVTTTPSNQRKLVMYSAHDTTLAALQMALNVSNGKLPPYASCHFFEIYQHEDGKHSIEMYYRNDSKLDPHPITLPGCSFSCPLQKFIELTSSVIVEDWEKECENVKKPSGAMVGMAITVTLLILSVIVLGFIVCRNHIVRSSFQPI
ncbi:prostatic acid phosphatase [Discoglossus pictus]